MEGFSFVVSEHVLDGITLPIRSSVDALEVMLRVASYVQVSKPEDINNINATLFLVTKPAARLVIKRGDGFISLSFPFSISAMNDVVGVSCPQLGLDVDARAIFFVRMFLDGLWERDVIDVIAEMEQMSPDYQDFLDLALLLINCDHGYFRMDYDPANVNGDIHPLNHIDFFYANYSAVKVGLADLWNIDALKRLVNKTVSRPFLAFSE